jgi:hypothetical protein
VQVPDLNKTSANLPKPLPSEDRKPEKIRAERNLEKWPAIWQPAKAHTKLEARYFERDLTLADGKQVRAKVKVGFTDEGMLTTEDQKTYYALVKHWHDSEGGDEVTPFSIRKLAKILHKNGWGTNVIESITESLSRLRVTPFTWTNSYVDGSNKEVLEEIDRFTILADLKIVRRKKDGHITYEAGYYRFNDFITKNLLSKHTKPVLFDTILKFKSPIAQLLYTHVDLMLYGKSQYERRTLELFDELGLKGTAYKNPSNRKQKLIPALKELAGVQVTSGWISEATLERTKDGKDYKVVFRKAAAPEPAGEDVVLDSPDETPVEVLSEKDTLVLRAEELIRHFHKLFHQVENHTPQLKEVGQAVSLIASLGFDKARYVIDFSRSAAEETKYKPQTFGGILQYTNRAGERYEAACLAKENSQQRQAKQDEDARLEAAYDTYLSSAIDQFLVDPDHQAEMAGIYELERAVLRGQFPQFPGESLEILVKYAGRKEIRERLKLLSFDEFVRQQMESDRAAAEPTTQPASGTDITEPAGEVTASEPEGTSELSSPQHQDGVSEPATNPIAPETDSGTAV